MNQRTDPSNPEAALLDLGGRPSLEWLQFAIEELTPFTLNRGNGTLSLFIKWAYKMGWTFKEVSYYLEEKVNQRSLRNSLRHVEISESSFINEADAVIESLI